MNLVNTKTCLIYILIQLLELNSFAQNLKLKDIEQQLDNDYSQIFPFYYGNNDSLQIHSNLFSKKLLKIIEEYPTTLEYPFKLLTDSNDCKIVTSAD